MKFINIYVLWQGNSEYMNNYQLCKESLFMDAIIPT
jgi:hypothetical protein